MIRLQSVGGAAPPRHPLKSASEPLLPRSEAPASAGNVRFTDASADAYNAYAIVSAVVFGSAVSSFVNLASITNDAEQHRLRQTSSWPALTPYAPPPPLAYNAPPTQELSPAVLVFALLIAVVTALSGYSTAIMTMQYYAAKILRERAHPDRLRVFLQSTWHFRRAARHATWAALCLYLPAIGVLAFEILPLPFALAAFACFLVGALLLAAVGGAINRSLEEQLSCSANVPLSRATTPQRGDRHPRPPWRDSTAGTSSGRAGSVALGAWHRADAAAMSDSALLQALDEARAILQHHATDGGRLAPGGAAPSLSRRSSTLSADSQDHGDVD